MRSIARSPGLTLLTAAVLGGAGGTGSSGISRRCSCSRPVSGSRSISESLRSIEPKRPDGFGHPGATGGAVEFSLSSRGVPEGQARDRLVLVDVHHRAGAQDVLPGQHVAGTTGVVGTVAGVPDLGEGTEEGRLERPRVRGGGDVGGFAYARAPRRRELGSRGSVSVVGRDVAGIVDPVEPAFDEAGVHVGRARA